MRSVEWLRGLVALGFLVLPFSTAASESAEPGECISADSIEATTERLVPTIESFVLENGLRVHLAPRRGGATVSVRVAYDVGATDEVPGRGGLAHFLEHMMFKGGDAVPDGGHFRLVRDIGGTTNATTDYDLTQYWNTVPTRALDRVLFAEADRMRRLRIDETNLANQRDAIGEEGLGLENLPYVDAATRFGLDLWAGTPYGHSPLGTESELAAVTREEAERFRERFYAPANAVLVVAGAFDPGAARRAIASHFATIPAGSPRPARPAWELDRAPRESIASDPLAPFPIFAVVWQTVGATAPSAASVAVLDDLLMGSSDARFQREIAAPLTLDAYSVSLAFRDIGLLNYVFVPHTYVGVAEIRAAVRREVQALRDEGPGRAETCRSVQRIVNDRLTDLETAEGVAAAIARGALFRQDPRVFAAELSELARVDAATLERAARELLVLDFHTLEIRPTGLMRWLKPVLEFLPDSIGASLEASLL